MKDVSSRSAGSQLAPKARADGLVVQELMDEVLVYDLKRHRSHCLNRTAALVWRHCDGSKSVAEMTRHLHRELGTPVEEEAVWLALSRLSRAHLLEGCVRLQAGRDRSSRRALLRRLGAISGAALVSSIAVPSAFAAGSNIILRTCQANCCSTGNGCGGCNPGMPANCNNCKCCFLPNGTTICSGDCGASCQQLNGTCCNGPCKGNC
jgi:hypothetical protein